MLLKDEKGENDEKQLENLSKTNKIHRRPK